MNEKLDILQMLQDGTLSVDEASTLLEALSGADSALIGPALDAPDVNAEPPAALPDMGRFRRLSYIPFALSVALLALTGGCLYAMFLRTEGQLTFGFVLLLALFVLSLLLSLLALWATTVPWLHVHIRSAPQEGSYGTHLAISLPLPLSLAGWIMQFAHRFVDRQAVGQIDAAVTLVQAMRHDLGKPGAEPIVVDVNDDSERVQVYIG